MSAEDVAFVAVGATLMVGSLAIAFAAFYVHLVRSRITASQVGEACLLMACFYVMGLLDLAIGMGWLK